MYTPAHFSEDRPDQIHLLIEDNPLGALVTHGAGGLDANHIPFEVVIEDGRPALLRGHVARTNPIVQQVGDGDGVLVIFRAADAYISPNWYPSKSETHRQVPTWNYQVVHVHGRIRMVDDEKFVRAVVGRLTRRHEAVASPDKPWRMADAPRDYMEAMLKAIVGIEVEIIRLVGKVKLSQNRDERDRLSAAEALETHGKSAISAAMRTTRAK